MSNSQLAAVGLSRKTLRVLTALNLVMGVLIAALLIASIVATNWVFTALGVPETDQSGTAVAGMWLIMVIGISAVPITHVVLTRLLAIVDTVTTGNPFIAANAARLKTIAWAVLGLELLHLIVGAIATVLSSHTQSIDLDWNFSFTRWVAVLMLFVLATVFEYGASMRDDLEGTI